MGLSLDWPIGDSSDEWLIVSCVVWIGGGELVPAVTMRKAREKRREGAMTKSAVPNVRYRPPEMVFPLLFFYIYIFLFIYSCLLGFLPYLFSFVTVTRCRPCWLTRLPKNGTGLLIMGGHYSWVVVVVVVVVVGVCLHPAGGRRGRRNEGELAGLLFCCLRLSGVNKLNPVVLSAAK